MTKIERLKELIKEIMIEEKYCLRNDVHTCRAGINNIVMEIHQKVDEIAEDLDNLQEYYFDNWVNSSGEIGITKEDEWDNLSPYEKVLLLKEMKKEKNGKIE